MCVRVEILLFYLNTFDIEYLFSVGILVIVVPDRTYGITLGLLLLYFGHSCDAAIIVVFFLRFSSLWFTIEIHICGLSFMVLMSSSRCFCKFF